MKMIKHLQKIAENKMRNTAHLTPGDNSPGNSPEMDDTDQSDFVAPKKTNKRKTSAGETELVTSNKYQVLSTATEPETTQDNQNFPLLKKPASQHHRIDKIKPRTPEKPHSEEAPPIVVQDKAKWTHVSAK